LKLVTINWDKIESISIEYFDYNKDGKIDLGDFHIFMDKYSLLLASQVPSEVCFLAAFWLAFK
jgi:hypothetical protein